MQFDIPKIEPSIIKVIGVGGGGSNAVNNMFKQGIVGVDFAICNTDGQALEASPIPNKIQLGPSLTDGMGAGSKPERGRQACLESLDDVKRYLADKTKMLFITAGMGGGTGTGAAPVIAKAAREMDILTVGIVTLPFTFEGRRRTRQGFDGLEELRKNVDTLVVISNDKLRQIHGPMSLTEAFLQADNILTTAAKGIAEIITLPGYVNVDFEDVNTVMRESGVAIMGTAETAGDDRAIQAVNEALNSPLLEESDIKGAKHILLNITSGTREVTMDEIFEITDYVQEEAGYGTDLIWGHCFDENLGDKISITLIATGFENTKPMDEDGDRKRVILDNEDPTEEAYQGKFFEQTKDSSDDEIVVEFDNIQKNRYSYKKPYEREEDKIRREEERKRRRAAQSKEKEQLRDEITNIKLSNPQNVMDLENTPAYLRRKISLDDIQHSSEVEMSDLVVSTRKEPEIRENNSYLHDNVD
jgi:cell division protein FtsZ